MTALGAELCPEQSPPGLAGNDDALTPAVYTLVPKETAPNPVADDEVTVPAVDSRVAETLALVVTDREENIREYTAEQPCKEREASVTFGAPTLAADDRVADAEGAEKAGLEEEEKPNGKPIPRSTQELGGSDASLHSAVLGAPKPTEAATGAEQEEKPDVLEKPLSGGALMVASDEVSNTDS